MNKPVYNYSVSIRSPGGTDVASQRERSGFSAVYASESVRDIHCAEWIGNESGHISLDAIGYGFQIARGMSFLETSKPLHRDLAARNILLADGNTIQTAGDKYVAT